MKTIRNSARHGELYIDRINKLPKGVKKIEPKGGVYVAAHSESGHSHVIDVVPGVNIYETDDPMVSYLEALEITDQVDCLLRHLKVGKDAHETLKFAPGIYELRKQSEADNSPQGWRRALD